MTFVQMPYSSVFATVYDSESPWKESDQLRSEVGDWLDEHSSHWDWDFGSNADVVVFEIKDHRAALLFKLTWGGM